MINIRILIVDGCRPGWIKLISVIKELKKEKKFKTIVCNTGQHREMSDEILKLFKIKPDYNLDIMKKKQSISYIVSKSVSKLDKIIKKEKPSLVIVLGDTSSALSGAMAGFFNKIPVMHIEAGVRSETKHEPYPEEINRRLITQLATYNMCQCKEHQKNLEKEGVKGILTGNTGIDAMKLIKVSNKKENIVLITMHRRENWGKNIEEICKAIVMLSSKNKENKYIVLCHPNPIVFNSVNKILGKRKNVIIKTAMRYDKFIKLLAKAKFVISDSGGIGMEAPVFKTPIFIVRNFYENTIVTKLGLGKVVGCSNRFKIFEKIFSTISNPKKLNSMKKNSLPYSDGKAGKKVVEFIKNEVNK